jgi:hypothetical protein
MVLATPRGSRAAAVVAGQLRRARPMMPHAEASPTAHRRERTRHRAAHRSASFGSLLRLVSHRDRCRCDAIPEQRSSSPRMPEIVSPCRHPTASATLAADLPTSVSIMLAGFKSVRTPLPMLGWWSCSRHWPEP